MDQIDNWVVRIHSNSKSTEELKPKEISEYGEDFNVRFDCSHYDEKDKEKIKDITVVFKNYPIVSLEIEKLVGKHETTKGIISTLEIKKNGKCFFTMNKSDLESILRSFSLIK